ncbi:hypothetical protein [Solidesulfovibrio alcoholivorans]|uniref:hypothetical protein n=1 Tax=Solidesulfovibrio alcoholivorans TaxID=81406 RepID=UPI0012EC32E1|nr:hypothetical protein [Solidesulfovibrio alcoholivorans]
MTDAPYNPETGEWTVFADPRPDKAGPYGKAVAHVPGTRPYSTPTQVLLWGDVKRAESYYPQAAQLLAQANRENVNDQPYFFKERKLGGDVRFKCRRDLYQDFIEIEAKPKPVSPGPLHLNFDSSADGFLSGNIIKDKNVGMPIEYPAEMDGYSYHQPGIVKVNGVDGLGILATDPWKGRASSGSLYFTPKEPSLNKTMFVLLNFSNDDSIDIGFGTGRIRKELWYDKATCGLDFNYSRLRGVTTVKEYSYGYSYASNDPAYSSIVSLRYDVLESKLDPLYGGTVRRVNALSTLCINGSVVFKGEESYSYGGGNGHNVYSHIQGSMGCSLNFSQFMICDQSLSGDDVCRLTDELAKKWGF